MSTESAGFPDEPTFSLAALAGQEQLRERLYAAQNALVRRDAEIARLADERAQVRVTLHLNPCQRCNGSGSEPETGPDEAAGLVLVAREDLRLAVSALRDLAGHASEPLGDFARRLAGAAGSAPSGHPTSPESGHAVLPGITPRTAAGEAAECDSEPQAGDRP